ncbi:MAG: hypothetical protein C4K60_06550 [Ideonella sp. MAG2]|nr:MAG: hypothetical protein C4K60_06550 [Ideonella sp. MAG2]
MSTMLNAPIVEIGQFDWTITDTKDGRGESTPYIFGKLSKYAKDGHVTIVDESSRSQVDAYARNLLEASSPFVYLPQYSGIAFLHVWNGIQEDVFGRHFQKIIEEAYDRFFVGCEIDPITDYTAFSKRLESIDVFTEISAKVYPPNPLFGRLWGSLNEYVKKRRASDVSVKETSSTQSGISTQVAQLVREIMTNPNYEPNFEPDITDAAVLMAADGYGSGKITGFEGATEVVIRTSDSQKSFLFDKDPIASELVREVEVQFRRVSIERDMGH